MKKALILSLVLLTVIIGCKKRDITPFDYTISGITDVTLEKYSTVTMPVEIKTKQGEPEYVSMSITGVPENVSVSFNPDHGLSPYNSGVVFTTEDKAKEGTYPVTITVFSLSTYYKTYKFNLKVVAANGCQTGRIGRYFVTSDCSVDSYYVNIIKDPALTNGIMIQNFGNFSVYPVTLHMILNCDAKTISIPTQTEDSTGLQFSGVGEFNGNNIYLTYDMVDGPQTTTCHMTLKK